jgi:hypothetical protein
MPLENAGGSLPFQNKNSGVGEMSPHVACGSGALVRASSAAGTGRGGALVDRGHAAAAGLALKQGVHTILRENATDHVTSTWLWGLLSVVVRSGLLLGVQFGYSYTMAPPPEIEKAPAVE